MVGIIKSSILFSLLLFSLLLSCSSCIASGTNTVYSKNSLPGCEYSDFVNMQKKLDSLTNSFRKISYLKSVINGQGGMKCRLYAVSLCSLLEHDPRNVLLLGLLSHPEYLIHNRAYFELLRLSPQELFELREEIYNFSLNTNEKYLTVGIALLKQLDKDIALGLLYKIIDNPDFKYKKKVQFAVDGMFRR